MTRLEQDYCNLAIKALLSGDCSFDTNDLIVRCEHSNCSICTAYNNSYNDCGFNVLLINEPKNEMDRIETLVLLPFLQTNHPELLL